LKPRVGADKRREPIGAIVDGILSKNPKAVKDFEGGKQNSFQFLVGQTLAVTRAKANPDVVKKIILEKITKINN